MLFSLPREIFDIIRDNLNIVDISMLGLSSKLMPYEPIKDVIVKVKKKYIKKGYFEKIFISADIGVLESYMALISYFRLAYKYVPDSKDLAIGLKCDNLELVKFVIENKYYKCTNDKEFQYCAVATAVANNNVPMLKYLIQNKFRKKESACRVAVENNNLSMLKLLNQYHFFINPYDCMNEACKQNNLDIIKFIDKVCRFSREFLCNDAARNASIEILKWAIDSEYNFGNSIYIHAVSSGNLEIVKYVNDILEIKKEDIMDATKTAAGNGYFSILRWLYDKHGELNPSVCAYIADCDDKDEAFQQIKWAYGLGYSIEGVCFSAAGNGNLELIKWSLANGNTLSSSIYEQLIRCGTENKNFECLEWCIDTYPNSIEYFDNDVIYWLTKTDAIDLMIKLIGYGLVISDYNAHVAANYNAIKIFELVLSKGARWRPDSYLYHTIEYSKYYEIIALSLIYEPDFFTKNKLTIRDNNLKIYLQTRVPNRIII